jgi:uncharacterized membrane protein (UPF0127 family)
LTKERSKAPVRLVVAGSGAVACERCRVADTPLTRLRGLLGRKSLPLGEGLLIRPAGAVHMFFMRFPIDVVFLDGDLGVVGVVEELKPWRAAGRRGARSVLELAAGEVERRGIGVGDRLAIDASGDGVKS